MKKLVFIRHGKSEGNVASEKDRAIPQNQGLSPSDPGFIRPNWEEIILSKPNSHLELVEEGIAQAHTLARQLSRYLKQNMPAVIFSSKYTRALQTREILVEDLIQEDERFCNVRLYDHECLNEFIQAEDHCLTQKEGHYLIRRLESVLESTSIALLEWG